MKNHFSVPIAIIIYKRPKLAKALLGVLQNIKPKDLWIIADGSKDKSQDFIMSETRKVVEANITWPCITHKIYAKNNLGLKQRVISGLNTVFQNVDQAIILEDDCLPNEDFFLFCEEMLEKYEKDKSVMSVSGGNYLFKQQPLVKESYYFSKYFHVWGWATWARAWKLYDSEFKYIDNSDIQNLKSNVQNPWANWYWQTMIKKIRGGKINDTWDYQWTLTHIQNNGLSIIPAKNLVINQGFGADATHTRFHHPLADLKLEKLSFPLTHPKATTSRVDLDNLQEKLAYINWRSILGLLLR